MSLYVTGFLSADKVKHSRISSKREIRRQKKRKNKYLVKALTYSIGYKLKKIKLVLANRLGFCYNVSLHTFLSDRIRNITAGVAQG